MTQYQKALEIKPNFDLPHIGLGMALGGKGKVDEAIAQYERALEIDPYRAEVHNNLANALSQSKGHVDEAIAQYQAALEIDPNLAEVHNNFGNALLK